jgi:hypothetical protein
MLLATSVAVAAQSFVVTAYPALAQWDAMAPAIDSHFADTGIPGLTANSPAQTAAAPVDAHTDESRTSTVEATAGD